MIKKIIEMMKKEIEMTEEIIERRGKIWEEERKAPKIVRYDKYVSITYYNDED